MKHNKEKFTDVFRSRINLSFREVINSKYRRVKSDTNENIVEIISVRTLLFGCHRLKITDCALNLAELYSSRRKTVRDKKLDFNSYQKRVVKNIKAERETS